MEYIKLGTICSKIGSGSTPKGGASVYIDEGTSLIRSQNVYNLNFQYKGLAYITEEAAYKLRGVTVKKNDVLINITGDSVARTCIVPDDVIPARVNQHVAIIRPDENVINPYYLNYYLASPFMQATMLNFAVGKGASRNAMTKEMIEKFLIPCPTIFIQSKIVEVLKAYDNLIENNNKRIKLLEQMTENLYKEWFVRFRFPGYEDVEFEEKKPRGWQVGTEDKKHFAPAIFRYDEFGTIGSFVRGKNITAAQMIEGNIPVISAGLQPSGYHNEANVFGENLTISASGANAGYLQYNLNDIWAADCSYYQDNATIWFVYNTLKHLQPVISNLQCGAAQPHVYPKNINSLCILIPTEELIHKYNDFVKPYYDEIKVLNQHNQLLTQQRDMLLPRLMSGKLEV